MTEVNESYSRQAEAKKEYDKYTFLLKVVTAPSAGGFVLFAILAGLLGLKKGRRWAENLKEISTVLSALAFIVALITMIFFLVKRNQNK